jgi:hypothetical protein
MNEHYIYKTETDLPPDERSNPVLFISYEDLNDLAGERLADVDVVHRGDFATWISEFLTATMMMTWSTSRRI